MRTSRFKETVCWRRRAPARQSGKPESLFFHRVFGTLHESAFLVMEEWPLIRKWKGSPVS
jgi:hypothetical protein